MNRRALFLGMLAFIGAPAMAQSYTDLPAGTRVFSEDGRLVGVFRSKARERPDGVRLFIDARRSRVFRNVENDIIADVSPDNIRLAPEGVVLAAGTQTLRNRLSINRNEKASGRLRLTK